MRRKGTHRSATSTKGWSKSSPDTVKARRRLLSRCGRGAFLDIRKSKTGKVDPEYPIVAGRSTVCAPDCRGLWAAKQRASQQGKRKLVVKATRIAKAAGCHWAR